MVRRGQHRKHAQRRSDKHRDSAIERAQTAGEYVPPSRPDCKHVEAVWPWGESGLIRIEAWKWSTADGLADYALRASVIDYTATEWSTTDLARIDICHGHAHLHLLYPEEREDPLHIRRIDRQSDVQDAYHDSIGVIQEIASRLDRERNEQ